jgi:lysozyme family protein
VIHALPPTNDRIFDLAVARVFEHEGLFSNAAADPGGSTKYGISLRLARELHGTDGWDFDLDSDEDVDADDIRTMPAEKALEVYRVVWWDKHNYGQFGLSLGGRLFDFAVNMGARPAHKLFQRALRAVTTKPIADDGIIGPITRSRFQESDPRMVIPALRSEAAGHYRLLASVKPKLSVFLPGWLNRAYS